MSKANVLVIEDNEEVRENLVEILEISAYSVKSASNGLDGVKIAIQDPPDIILCDIIMPSLDGFGVLHLLNENERTATIPFVFITARTEKEDIRRGMTLGADDYITKPFYIDELIQVIERRLQKVARIKANGTGISNKLPQLSDPGKGRKNLDEAFDKQGRQKVFDQGQSVVRDGEFPHFIYRVNTGRVHLTRIHEYGREYIIAELGPGEIFGVGTLLEAVTFHYSARVASQTLNCQLLPKENVLKLMNTDRTVVEALMRLLAKRTMVTTDRLVNQAYDSVRRRTALVLCDLQQKYGAMPIELSREELAQMVGASKESVIRALSDFKKEGLLATDGRLIHLQDPKALRGLLI